MVREIAAGVDGRPLSGEDAQKRAQMALNKAGYRWSGYAPELGSTEVIRRRKEEGSVLLVRL
jgi:hypothetical protein